MFGIYIHIPYCLQRCSYCDFATYVYDQILPPQEYVVLLKKELQEKKSLLPSTALTSIYFGGGTPSLLPPPLILSLLEDIAKLCVISHDPAMTKKTEITIEINPATLTEDSLEAFISAGINRFSVGAQTFNDRLLKLAGRKHNSDDTRKTLDLLKKKSVNYTFDLLFALPHQSLSDLEQDLYEISQYAPPHLSAYCLTVPTGHPMSFQRPSDEAQTEMFAAIESSLKNVGLLQYEISNFAQPGFESQHNLLYWHDGDFLGLGVSAHSYLKSMGPWGTRFWNPSNIDQYKLWMQSSNSAPLDKNKTENCWEVLREDQALFDFCHTALRLSRGLEKDALYKKFTNSSLGDLENKLRTLSKQGLILEDSSSWRLSPEGLLLSNRVFESLLS